MYFLHGWPKSYKLPQKAEPVLAIRHSPDYALIAVVTASTLYIWSGDQVCARIPPLYNRLISSGAH
jgi:hypothetical protein